MRTLLVGAVMAMSTGVSANAQDSALNVQEWRSAAEVIELARQKIDEAGWYQVEVVAGAECMATALEKSWQELEKTLVDWDYVKLAVDRAIDAPGRESLSVEGDPLSTPYWGRYYMYWNDAEGRTEEEVLAALTRAVEFARAQEQAALETNASGDQVIEYDIRMMDQLGLPMAERFR